MYRRAPGAAARAPGRRRAPRDDVEPDLVLTVHKGEMLWFPPGWGHEVITLEGQV
eukprot:COSAG05_NODE_2159_length_3456_cov_1.492404_2_plen_54_part_01